MFIYSSQLTYLFDNEATVFFACFMSLWGKYLHLLLSFKFKFIYIQYFL